MNPKSKKTRENNPPSSIHAAFCEKVLCLVNWIKGEGKKERRGKEDVIGLHCSPKFSKI